MLYTIILFTATKNIQIKKQNRCGNIMRWEREVFTGYFLERLDACVSTDLMFLNLM